MTCTHDRQRLDQRAYHEDGSVRREIAICCDCDEELWSDFAPGEHQPDSVPSRDELLSLMKKWSADPKRVLRAEVPSITRRDCARELAALMKLPPTD